ncbi:hypothetical protein BTJ68_13345 [Hortaea werneckii EXF-2000]|nr:hypothetical protein BTJ68_13345 [Hortaea werneckii EXF-2000]
MPLRSSAFHSSTPQITLGRDWFTSRLASPLKRFPDNGFHVFNSTIKVEEEKWPWYSSEAFYPARIWQLLHARYQIIGKLGYGGHSTAWLCRDLRAERERLAYTRMNSLKSTHNGSLLIRKMLDTFEIDHRGQKHTCLIHEPLGISLETLRCSSPPP